MGEKNKEDYTLGYKNEKIDFFRFFKIQSLDEKWQILLSGIEMYGILNFK